MACGLSVPQTPGFGGEEQKARSGELLRQEVSGLTLCPLVRPEKAIGRESQIEPWLTPETRLLRCVESRRRRHIAKMKFRKRQKPRASLHDTGCKVRWNTPFFSVAAEMCLLTFPFIERANRPKTYQYLGFPC